MITNAPRQCKPLRLIIRTPTPTHISHEDAMKRVSRGPSASSAPRDCELKHRLGTILHPAEKRKILHDPSPRKRRNCVNFVQSQILTQTPYPLSNQKVHSRTKSSPEESNVPQATPKFRGTDCQIQSRRGIMHQFSPCKQRVHTKDKKNLPKASVD